MMKYTFIIAVATVYVQCSAIKYKYAEAWMSPKFCSGAGLECDTTRTSPCWPGGNNIKGVTRARCLCNWGWTGKNAEYVPNYLEGKSEKEYRKKKKENKERLFGINRIRADDCDTPCPYEPNRWNSACAKSGQVRTTPRFPDCDEDDCKKRIHGVCINDVCTCHQPYCAEAGGECDEGVCKKRCCKNLMTGIPLFSGSNFNSYCKEKRCHLQKLKTSCPTPRTPNPIFNPKCKKTGGLPDEATGYCQCCKDFTGPSAFYEGDKLYADYCDVYCPHENQRGSSNMLCVNPDYVRRARDLQTTR